MALECLLDVHAACWTLTTNRHRQHCSSLFRWSHENEYPRIESHPEHLTKGECCIRSKQGLALTGSRSFSVDAISSACMKQKKPRLRDRYRSQNDGYPSNKSRTHVALFNLWLDQYLKAVVPDISWQMHYQSQTSEQKGWCTFCAGSCNELSRGQASRREGCVPCLKEYHGCCSTTLLLCCSAACGAVAHACTPRTSQPQHSRRACVAILCVIDRP